MKKLFNTLIIVSIYLLTTAVFASTAHAQSTVSTPVTDGNYHKEETFTIPILLQSTVSVNAFEMQVTYPDNVLFIGSDEGGSVVSLWVDSPRIISKNNIVFSGAIPSGFTEVFNPLNKSKSPGLITKLIFKAKSEGAGSIVVSPMLYANDGLGTLVASSGFTISITSDNVTKPTEYMWSDTVQPEEFSPVLKKDNLVYVDKYVLYFNAIDKGSGIAYYEVREGYSKWKQAVSPYLLDDQYVQSRIEVRAVDKAGNSRVASISPMGNVNTSNGHIREYIIVAIACMFLVVFIFRKRILRLQ